MNENSSLKGAPVFMKTMGKHTDEEVLTYVETNPGSTVGEIAGKLGITNGKADGSVNRLVENGALTVRHFLRNGRLVKRVYPKGNEIRHPEIVKISPELVDVRNWDGKAEIYALSRLAIGISPERNPDWEKISLYHEEVPIDKTDQMLSLKLPEQLIGFYEIPNSEVEVTGMDDKALLTIQSTVIPVDVPFDRREDIAHFVRRRIRAVMVYNEETFSWPEERKYADTGSFVTVNEMVRGSQKEKNIRFPVIVSG